MGVCVGVGTGVRVDVRLCVPMHVSNSVAVRISFTTPTLITNVSNSKKYHPAVIMVYNN